VSEPTTSPSRPARTPWLAGGIVAIAAIATVAVLATSQPSKKTQKNDPRLLVIDGIEITFEELKPYVDWFQAYRPELGIKTTYIWAMRDHLLPLKVARRAFPEERAKQLALAEGLCSVATNIYELETQSKLIEHKTRSNLTRQSAMIPAAMWLFDELNTNAVSPPIELPQGYFVVGSFEYFHSPLVMADYVDALQVGFVTHLSKEWRVWWENEQRTLGQKVTFVHPDYRDNLPKWMNLPKDKKP
tara:strand:+ start:626 stop:1357 length:732 start_codon:yes stop_codon:yes gene_type:complete